MRKPQERIQNASLARRVRRKLVIRKSVIGSAERPRLCLNKSNTNLFVQVIDDASARTLFAVKTFGKNAPVTGSNKEAAIVLGKEIGKELNSRKISTVVFDRNGYKYTGVVAALANAVRETGIKF
ncbi:MAG: 50S ribosomal protein L18 [Bdellovibrionales bacterium GWA2_49_15]|nr:MAG: 50S ribosomal protein L18 [Bdellovibrionales bacterium GWA2_49_15]HAZ12765.1 50S ribosomal protein L18 [Bdellovibrionales bacterium]